MAKRVDHDPEEGEGQFNMKGSRGGENKPRRHGSEEGGTDRRNGPRDRGGSRKSYSAGPENPGMTDMEARLRAVGIPIPDRSEVANTSAVKDTSPVTVTEKPTSSTPARTAANTTPPQTQAPTSVTEAPVSPAPTPVTVAPFSSGPTPEHHKEEPMTTQKPVHDAQPEENVVYSPLGSKTLERAMAAAAAMLDIAQIEKQILENPGLGEVTLVQQKLADAHEVVDKVQIPPLVDKIRTAATDQIAEIVAEATALGMELTATASGPYTLYWNGQAYVAPRSNKAWESLMIEFNRLKNKLTTEKRQKRQANLDAMRMEATEGLTLYALSETGRGEPLSTGKFIAFLPGQKPQNPGGRRHYDSHILVEIREHNQGFFVLQPLKAEGGHERLLEMLTDGGKKKAPFIPFFYLFQQDQNSVQDKLIRSLGEEMGKATALMCRILRAALLRERDAKRQADAKATVATPAAAATAGTPDNTANEMAAETTAEPMDPPTEDAATEAPTVGETAVEEPEVVAETEVANDNGAVTKTTRKSRAR